MRGKPVAKQLWHRRVGITPAGAGKTLPRPTSSATFWDHPRRCGENDVRLRKFDPVPGSPPQVRGKQVRTRTNAFCNRITPAGAGKTCLCWALRRNYWDHPRRCGENDRSHVKMRCCIGSPPQVRGKLGMAGFGIDTSRITPAGAGKTKCVCLPAAQPPDHPRRCGENPERAFCCPFGLGSPPQVRGKRK